VFGINGVLRAGSELGWSDPVSADPFGGTTQFLFEDEEDGSYTISLTTTGNPTQPIDSAGTYDLFTVTFTSVSEGVADVAFGTFVMRDPNNVPIVASVGTSQITVDCTAPEILGITAEPGHEKVEVSWTHDGSPLDHFEVYRAVWYDTDTDGSAYPEYDDLATDVIPARPASHATIDAAVWELVDGDVDPAQTSLTDSTMTDGRGVYYYEVFAIDPATNASDPAAANDRATNYWLGDFDGDGEVDVIGDISPLGDAFGTEEGDASYNNIIDVGPTDDWSSYGIPTTDSKIDFEDLMITALNFGVVQANKDRPNISDSVDLVWTRLGASRWALHLESGEGLQGVRVRAALPPGTDVTLTPGELLGIQSADAFLRNVGDGLDISLALLGTGESITGAGELVVVDLSQSVELNEIEIQARSIENSEMEVAFSQATAVEIPTAFNLNQNFPNPFNPQTTIKFALPEAADVQLKVYGVDGRLVKTLVNETREAGYHEVVWRGDDGAGRRVATGTYFYVIDAGDNHQVRKMTLVK
jgi:hypothetical protein